MTYINHDMKCIKCGRDIFSFKEKYCNEHYNEYVIKPALKKMMKNHG